MRKLSPLAGENLARGLAVNDAGQIVGSSGGAHDVSAVIWTTGGTPQDLNGLATMPPGVILSRPWESIPKDRSRRWARTSRAATTTKVTTAYSC